MLLEFRVANFRSICEEQVLSLRPEPKYKDVPTNILTLGKNSALNALALYGANDSGKSNLLAAIDLLDRMVGTSVNWASTDPMPYDPFLLREGWAQRPTALEMTFVVGENRYRYGVSYKQGGVDREWLYRKGTGREVTLFERQGDIIETKPGLEASPKVLAAAIESTRLNSLFLSWCDRFNVAEIKRVTQWFYRLRSVNGLDTRTEGVSTAQMLRDSDLAQPIRDYLTSLGLRILDVDVKTQQFDQTALPPGMPESMQRTLRESLKGANRHVVLAKHRIYDAEGRPTAASRTWEWSERESAGAVKALELSGPVIWTLVHGGVLVIDEIEASLHTQLTLLTLNLFLNSATNPHGAQLLFATHDTNLLTYAALRRDQICFAEKNAWEGTETYALSDVQYLPHVGTTPERPDTDKEKRYLEGRYGAIPATADFRRFVEHIEQTQWLVPEK
jgi:hypothetical protein